MRLLVVDDDAAGAEQMATLLRLLGHEAEWAVNADGALARLGVFRFDAAILDERMPDLAGHELVRRMRGLGGYGSLPVVFLTAVSGVELRRAEAEAEGLGRATLVRKPADVKDVLAAIESLATLPEEGGR